MIYKAAGKYTVECDICGEELPTVFKSYTDAATEAEESGWTVDKDGQCACGGCSEEVL